ncbi:MAG: DUF4340 domain-containing protein [Hyphomicrobiales bacterium]
MKRNKFMLLIAAIIVGVAVYLLWNHSNSTLKIKNSAFAVRDTASIRKIFIADKENNFITLKREDGYWSINDKHIANNRQLDMLLETFRKINVARPVSKSGYKNIIKDMAATSKKVEIYVDSYRIKIGDWLKLFPYLKLEKTMYVGGPTQDNQGTYMLLEGADYPCITYIPSFRGFISTRFDVNADNWKLYSLFKAKEENISSIEMINNQQPKESFILNKNGNDYSIKYGQNTEYEKNLNKIKAYNYYINYKDVRFEAILKDNIDKHEMDSVCSSKPLYIIKLMQNDGTETKVRFFNMKSYFDENNLTYGLTTVDSDRLYAEVNEGENFVMVQRGTLQDLFVKGSYFKN